MSWHVTSYCSEIILKILEEIAESNQVQLLKDMWVVSTAEFVYSRIVYKVIMVLRSGSSLFQGTDQKLF
jgi:hypothetical protein